MLSRRIIRIKVLQMLYAYLKSEKDSIAKAEKELFHSINKTYDLYLYLLLFICEIKKYAEDRIEIGKNKKIPSYEDLHPNTKFIDNEIVGRIYNSDEFLKIISSKKINWIKHPELIKNFYNYLTTTVIYKNYLSSENLSYKDELNFIINIYSKEIVRFLDLYQALEEESIYWNDDIEFIVGMICKTLKNLNHDSTENSLILLPLFKNDEDLQFTKQLFRKSILKHNENIKLIDEFTENWDLERIAFMDILILSIGITEITEFSSIPIKVSFNEYLEIAKQYSTTNSSSFINGVLDKIVQKLKKDNKIIKTGRGLIGEV